MLNNRNFRYDSRDGVTISCSLIVLEDHQYDELTEGQFLFVAERYETDEDGKRFLADNERQYFNAARKVSEYFENTVSIMLTQVIAQETLQPFASA